MQNLGMHSTHYMHRLKKCVEVWQYKYLFFKFRISQSRRNKCFPIYISSVFKSTKRPDNKKESSTLPYQTVLFTPFDQMIENRKDEAQRSIVVQVNSAQSCQELCSYCSNYGRISGMHHYTLNGPLHFILLEFESEMSVHSVMKDSIHVNSSQVIPVRSPFLWFRAKGKSFQDYQQKCSPSEVPLIVEYGTNVIEEKELYTWLQKAESLSDQLQILYNSTCLNDLGTRLRFLTAHQIELGLSGPFPYNKAYPFGSSVNGFGRMGCDLDIVLHLDKDQLQDTNRSRLIFHAKTSLANGRTQAQRHMEMIGDLCQLFLPGCSNVKRILQARVPIIKYRQELSGIDCDLSMTNMSAVYMSELLYIFGELDPKVKPLVFAVRSWARSVGLTNPIPGRWITNFSLTIMVIFFLQQDLSGSILPTLNTLRMQAEEADHKITSDGVDCTFLRNINCLKHSQKADYSSSNLGVLFTKFFEFYSSFDFSSRGITLTTGTSVVKPEHCALYIANPLEQGLNVTKNVSQEEIEKIQIQMKNALWLLEVGAQKTDDTWGLLSLLKCNTSVPVKSFTPSRLVEVSELFDEKNYVQDTQGTNTSVDPGSENLLLFPNNSSKLGIGESKTKQRTPRIVSRHRRR